VSAICSLRSGVTLNDESGVVTAISAVPISTPTRPTRSGCCAHAASGHAAAPFEDPDNVFFVKEPPGSYGPKKECPRANRPLNGATDDQFKSSLRQTKPWSDGLTELGKLADLIRQFNEESARIAFAAQALNVSEETLPTISKLKGSFR